MSHGDASANPDQSCGRVTTGETSVEQQLHLWADELRSIANEGLPWRTVQHHTAFDSAQCIPHPNSAVAATPPHS